MSHHRKNAARPGGGLSLLKPYQSDTNVSAGAEDTSDCPLFSFRWYRPVSVKKCRDAKFFSDLLERLQKLSELGWVEIRQSGRHGFGMEKVPVSQIKPDITAGIVTPDVKELDVLRASGNNLPVVGLQTGPVFHVLFIETKFGDIYDHS